MIVTAYKTKQIFRGDDLYAIFQESIPALADGDVVMVTSKIVSLCEGSVVKNDGSVEKLDLVRREADYYLDVPLSQSYGVTITIKDDKLVANAGIDESNGAGYFILWPRNPMLSAAAIWKHLRIKHRLTHLGVIITDTHIVPLQWGTRGRAIAWCGIDPLKNYIGQPDIFGKKLHATKASVIDGLAAAAVAVMGEGNEQTPLAVIRDVPFVTFRDRPPEKKEIEKLHISLKDDIYAPILTAAPWRKNSI